MRNQIVESAREDPMLVIMSDLHLTDGTSGTTIDADAFNIFRERLKDLAWAASDRSVSDKEVYEPVKEIHLLLLGDILDVIRSTQWLQNKVRPWGDPTSKDFISKVRGASLMRFWSTTSRASEYSKALDSRG